MADLLDLTVAEAAAKIAAGEDVGAAVADVVKESYSANKQVCFGGDNYSDEWHAEAVERQARR